MKYSSATFSEEQKLWQQGYSSIIGLDEVGRGAWAGPLVVAGVIFPKDVVLSFDLADSKLLSPAKREMLVPKIKSVATKWTVVELSSNIIDKVGVGQANQRAFRKALNDLKDAYDYIFIDAFYVSHVSKKLQLPIIHGDAISSTIAAASILAKVHRDELLTKLDETYPNYGFAIHKGYGTKIHQEAIAKNGLCREHRTSYNLHKYVT